MKRHPGWVEVQDEGSQLVSLLLASLALASAREQTVPDGDSEDDGASARTIVDACAGGGGKTLAVADALSGEGKFHACDIDAAKLSDLLTRADPLGLRSLTVHGVSPQGELPRTLPRRADLVFTDVPCSGFGALRRNPDAKARYDEEAIAEFAQRQQGILERFAPTVRPGGYLAYVTCSILPHENENVVRRFLERFDDFEPATPPVIDRLPEDVVTPKGWIRLDPVTTATDGFFVACLRRIAPGD